MKAVYGVRLLRQFSRMKSLQGILVWFIKRPMRMKGEAYIHMLQHWLHVVNYILMSF